jgi:hypothetical protein
MNTSPLAPSEPPQRDHAPDGKSVSQILVATYSRANFLLVERASRNRGAPVIQVEQTVEALQPFLAGSHRHCVTIIDGLQGEGRALEFCGVVIAKYPQAWVLFMGSLAENTLLAKAAATGVRNFFTVHTPLEQLVALLGDALAERSPPHDSLFGSVCAQIPTVTRAGSEYTLQSGLKLSVASAITQCESLGLTASECMALLAVSPEQYESARRTKSKSGNMSRQGRSPLQRTVVVSICLLLGALFVGRIISSDKHGVPTREVRGQLSIGLSAADLRGAYICFWPLASKNKFKGSTRPSMVRVCSEDGRFSGHVIVEPEGSVGESGGYAVTILNGGCDVFSESILPSAYGDPEKTPLWVQDFSNEIIIGDPKSNQASLRTGK